MKLGKTAAVESVEELMRRDIRISVVNEATFDLERIFVHRYAACDLPDKAARFPGQKICDEYDALAEHVVMLHQDEICATVRCLRSERAALPAPASPGIDFLDFITATYKCCQPAKLFVRREFRDHWHVDHLGRAGYAHMAALGCELEIIQFALKLEPYYRARGFFTSHTTIRDPDPHSPTHEELGKIGLRFLRDAW